MCYYEDSGDWKLCLLERTLLDRRPGIRSSLSFALQICNGILTFDIVACNSVDSFEHRLDTFLEDQGFIKVCRLSFPYLLEFFLSSGNVDSH